MVYLDDVGDWDLVGQLSYKHFNQLKLIKMVEFSPHFTYRKPKTNSINDGGWQHAIINCQLSTRVFPMNGLFLLVLVQYDDSVLTDERSPQNCGRMCEIFCPLVKKWKGNTTLVFEVLIVVNHCVEIK